jgi:flagellar motor switch protein FliG
MSALALNTVTSADALTGAQRAAVLLMYLDRDTARGLLSHMTTPELKEIGIAMAEVEQVDTSVIESVVGSFVLDLYRASMVPTSGPEFALEVYPQLIDDTRRERIEGTLRRALSTDFADYVSTRPTATVAAIIADEHPQTQAVALLLMGSDNAARVMTHMEEEDRRSLVLRMTKIDDIPGELADDVERSLRAALADHGSDQYGMAGLDKTAKIIGRFDRNNQAELLEALQDEEPDLSEAIRKRMVVFDDLKMLSDRSMQMLLKNVERENLVVALRGADAELSNFILSNVSTRAAQDIRDEVEILGPVPRATVVTAQEGIVESMLELADDGILQLPIGGENDMV